MRSEEVADKIALHLERFGTFYTDAYGHERIRNVLKRDVLAWQRALSDQGLAPATVNNHLASLSGFTPWVHAQAPHLFAIGDPSKGISELGLPPLEPRTLSPEQVRSLKSVCDRLERFHQLRGRRWTKTPEQLRVRSTGRPLRDRAVVYVLLSTGLRREELVNVDLDQVSPNTPTDLRRARHVSLLPGARDKIRTQRTDEQCRMYSWTPRPSRLAVARRAGCLRQYLCRRGHPMGTASRTLSAQDPRGNRPKDLCVGVHSLNLTRRHIHRGTRSHRSA